MITRTFDTPGGLTLDVTIFAGELVVRAAETTVTSLRIDGGRDADDLIVDLRPAGPTDHQLVIEHRTKRAWGLFAFGADLHIDVTVPLGTAVICDAGSADVTTQGRIGSLGVRVGSGDVQLDEIGGDVTVKTASGDVTGRLVGGDLTVHGASSDVSVTRVGGAMVVRTASGDLQVDDVDGTVQVTTMSGDLRIRSLGGPSAELRSVSGDIDVGVPRGRGVYLDVSSLNGDVRSDLEAGTAPSDGPDLDLTASTVSGDIRVRRAPVGKDA